MKIATYIWGGQHHVGLVTADGKDIAPLAIPAEKAKRGVLELIEAIDRGEALPAPAAAHAAAGNSGRAEKVALTIAYGLAGFGYIITATFLPVIARAALPGSVWLDLFWPILGIGVAVGAVLALLAWLLADPGL